MYTLQPCELALASTLYKQVHEQEHAAEILTFVLAMLNKPVVPASRS